MRVIAQGVETTSGLDVLERDEDEAAVGPSDDRAVLRVVLGSVSGHLFRHAPCPLLVTRRP